MYEDDYDYIMHHGVKGMKWGVRKDRSGKLRARSTTAIVRRKTARALDSDVDGLSSKGRKLYNRTSRMGQFRVRGGIKAINNLDKYKGKNLNKDKALRKQYYKEMDDFLSTQMNAKASRWGNHYFTSIKFNYNTETSSTPTITLINKNSIDSRHNVRVQAKSEYKDLKRRSKAESSARKASTIKHSDDTESVTLKAVLDENGFIIDFVEPSVEHSELNIFLSQYGLEADCDYIAHAGVKGMKWGIRKAKGSSKKEESEGGGGGADEEEDEDDLKDKLDDVGDAVKSGANKVKKGTSDVLSQLLKKANKLRKDAGFVTDKERDEILEKERKKAAKKYGGMKIELEKKKKK